MNSEDEDRKCLQIIGHVLFWSILGLVYSKPTHMLRT